MTYTILDTNFFLHFEPIDQVDWLGLLNADQVTLVVPRRIIEEIDEQKDQNSQEKLRERARGAQQRIEQALLGQEGKEIRDSVTLDYSEKLSPTFFEENNLDRSTPDDHLVATGLYFEEEYPEAQVVVVTDDTGPRLTAKPYGIKTLRPPEELRLQPVESEARKELRELRLENERLKNRIPDLELSFQDGEKFAKFQVSPPEVRSEEEVEKKVDEIRQEYPEKEQVEVENSPLGAIKKFAVPPPEEIERYNDELPEFYEEYREYLEKLRKYRYVAGRVIELNLVLSNEGRTPAEDIDIQMHFPDGFLLTDSKLEPPPEPSPPRPPQSLGAGIQDLHSVVNPTPTPNLSSPSNVSSPDITETNSYEVEVHVGKIKHTVEESLDPLYVVFESYEAVNPFSFEYQIVAGNVPNPVTGTLHVVAEDGR
ncbi:PIN domain-containing protein [Salinibacter ruber]|uniref:PIN domain-containing protein n=1 Tax=Salinibacter ruber TaxID=146919 RepID=UPI002167215F|nr:PIN domain-containing protein [Salinibacter ruber]MCS3615881.1 hypothetical protein [Salinibacter ruber]